MSHVLRRPAPDPPIVAVRSAEDVASVVITDARGDVEEYRVRRAGKGIALRLAVGEPGRRGTVWRLWANRSTSDVYIASRHTAGELKISLDESGDWRIQTIGPKGSGTIHVHDLVEQHSEGRVLERWRRPEANSVGWTHAFSIVLPDRHLVTTPVDRWDDIQWHRPPGDAELVEIMVYLVRPNFGAMTYGTLLLNLGGYLTYMDALQLASDEVAVVLAFTMPIDEAEAAYITRLEEAGKHAADSAPTFEAATGPRHLIMSADITGTLRLYDLAHGPEEPSSIPPRAGAPG
jgi:hypothetical protein